MTCLQLQFVLLLTECLGNLDTFLNLFRRLGLLFLQHIDILLKLLNNLCILINPATNTSNNSNIFLLAYT